MNTKDLATSILNPSDGALSLEGTLSEKSSLGNFLGQESFKKVATTAFATLMLLTGSASALADNSPTSIIHPPSSIEVTFDKDMGNVYNPKAETSNELLNNVIKIKKSKKNEYEGSINLSLDFPLRYFSHAGDITKPLEGLDVSDFNNIKNQSEELQNYVETMSTPLHMNAKEFTIAAWHLEKVFEYTIDDLGGEEKVKAMSDKDKDNIVDEILDLIHDNENATKLFKATIDIVNNKHNWNKTEKEAARDIVQTSRDDRVDIFVGMSNFSNMKSNLVSEKSLEKTEKLGLSKIYSNIANQYNLKESDIIDLMKLTVATHEYTHMVDSSHKLNLKDLVKRLADDFPEKEEDLTEKQKELLNIVKFDHFTKKEALADLAAIPIAIASYAKKTGQEPALLVDAIMDTMLIFRSSTFSDDTLDSHIGAVNSVLFWNDHRNELTNEANDIFNKLPDDMNFDEVVGDNVDNIYSKYFKNQDFKNELFEPKAKTFDVFKSEYEVGAANAKYKIMEALSNMRYDPIFNLNNEKRVTGTPSVDLTKNTPF